MALNEKQTERLNELRDKPLADRSDEEKTELEQLEHDANADTE